MEQFLQASINGLMLGGFYAVVVLGFSIVWGVMGVINLAHGEFIMVSAYLTWVMNRFFGWEPLAALAIVIPVMFMLGFALQHGLINHIIDHPPMISLMVTYAISIVLSNALKSLFTGTPRSVTSVLSGYWSIPGGLTVPVSKSADLILAIVIMVMLHFFLQYTRLGKSVRAAAQNRQSARMVGIEIATVYAFTFSISLSLTGVAGMLISLTQPIFPFMGLPFTLKAFAIAAMSGLGNIRGAFIGSLILGLIEVFVATYVPGVGTNMGIIISFVILVLVLVLRPQGMFGGLRPVEAQ